MGGVLLESLNGWYMPPHGTVRILLILAEVDYTGGVADPTGPTGTAEWPAHQLPMWVNNVDPTQNLFDWNAPVGAASGMFTRYYQEASSGNLVVLGDHLVAPSNGGIFKVPSPTGSISALDVFAAVNTALGTSIVTGHGFSNISDFDGWMIDGTTYGPGRQKVTPSTENPRKFDHVMIICRNSMGNNGTGWASPGGAGVLLGREMNTHSMFGAYGSAPFKIARHEFAHLLYGGNNFHTGGGGWPEVFIQSTQTWTNSYGQYWINQSSGWSNLSLYNGSLLTWNAWDRQRMGWKRPGQMNEIPARNAANTAEIDGDLDATVSADAGTYVLRDFVTTGDALRIKLPFTDPSTEYPEFIWVENHQGYDVNGDPFDRVQYSADCMDDVVPGLSMYLQIDKEVRRSTSYANVYGGPGDYLRPLDANGHFDDALDPTDQTTTCICWMCPTRPFSHGLPNALSGTGDRYVIPVDLNNSNSLMHDDGKQHSIEHVGGGISRSPLSIGECAAGIHPVCEQEVGYGDESQFCQYDEPGRI